MYLSIIIENNKKISELHTTQITYILHTYVAMYCTIPFSLQSNFWVNKITLESRLPNTPTCWFIFFQEKICPVRAY